MKQAHRGTQPEMMDIEKAKHSAEQPEFSNNWFGLFAEGIWGRLMPALKPRKVLEIGSFEGRSLCFLIDRNDWTEMLELHCVDTWEGGIEHKDMKLDMASVEKRFDANTALMQRTSKNPARVIKHKGPSDRIMAGLIAQGLIGHFDFIYIDGSHQAPDVLTDAIMAFRLLRTGGVMGFDDYTWYERLSYGKDPIRSPKIAIDAFTTIFCRKIRLLNTVSAQVYFEKVAD